LDDSLEPKISSPLLAFVVSGESPCCSAHLFQRTQSRFMKPKNLQ